MSHLYVSSRLSSTNTSEQQLFGLAPSRRQKDKYAETISPRLSTTDISEQQFFGPGPSNRRQQDKYAVLHISCFPADYSESLLRRHFGVEFVTLTVYTNRSGMYIIIPSSVRVVTFLTEVPEIPLGLHYLTVWVQSDMNFRWQVRNRRSGLDISGWHTPVFKQHHN